MIVLRNMWLKWLFYFGLVCTAEGAKILCLMQMPMYSHYVVFHTLYKELAARGHNVTLMSPFKETLQHENFRSILLDFNKDLMNEHRWKLAESVRMNALSKNMIMEEVLIYITENFFNNTSVQELIRSREHFDLIIMQENQNMAMKALCFYFEIPCVTMSSFYSNRWTNAFMSNAGPPSCIPEITTKFHGHMNFYERFVNSVIYFITHMYTYVYVIPRHEKIIKKYIPNAPNIYEVIYNTSLMLINTHYSIHSAVPYGPNMIEVGGLHIKPSKSLSKDLQHFLDNAIHGVVYFSLGSNLQSTFLPESVKISILNVFSKLKQRVLWKWNDEITFKSDNILLQKWFPQNDVLAHPSIKVFVTQGGQMSSMEAIHHGIPLLGIPVFADQHVNIANSIDAGYALSIALDNFSEEKFHSVLNELLNNSSYYETAKRRSRIFHDQPMKPLEKAIYWIEHVVRHGDAMHLKPIAATLYWYQYFLVDVVFVIVFLLIISGFSLTFIIKVLISFQSNKNQLLKKNK